MNSNVNDLTLELDTLARNMFGKLDQHYKQRIRQLVENPCQETWGDASCIIIRSKSPMLTVWQAVCALDSSYVRIGRIMDSKGRVKQPWKKIPPRDLIIRAIKWATH